MRAVFPHSLASTDANTRKADGIYVLFCAFNMFKMIERPADCEIRCVICFLNAINLKLADIQRQICEVHAENAMSEGMVRKWIRKFSEGRDNVQDEPRSGWPSVVRGDHVLRKRDKETGAPL